MEGRLHDFPIQVPDCQLPYGRRDWRWGELLIVKRWNLPPHKFRGAEKIDGIYFFSVSASAAAQQSQTSEAMVQLVKRSRLRRVCAAYLFAASMNAVRSSGMLPAA